VLPVLNSDSVQLARADVWRPHFTLLIVDPALDHSDPLVAELERQHIEVTLLADAAEALVLVGTLRPDAVVLAADLGELSSGTFVRALARHTRIPTVVGVAAGEGDQADAALGAGASAAIARPFRLPELILILRSFRPEAVGMLEPALVCGGLSLDPSTLDVRLHDRPIRLPLREYQVLRFFMIHVDRVVTRDQIYDAVWGGAGGDASNTLTVHINRLRKRLGDDHGDPQIIVTVRGLGYRFVAPPQRSRDLGETGTAPSRAAGNTRGLR
jgi:DNA-binding response OmpR family regulator